MAGEPKYEFDPFKETGVNVPPKRRREAAEAAAEYVKEQILLNTSEGKTSVQGGLWKKKLSPEYKKEKAEESGVSFANLELTGQMLDALDARVSRGNRIVVEISDREQAAKAEGNLLGSYGQPSPDADKAREFMPHKRGQHLRQDIIKGVKEILKDYADEE